MRVGTLSHLLIDMSLNPTWHPCISQCLSWATAVNTRTAMTVVLTVFKRIRHLTLLNQKLQCCWSLTFPKNVCISILNVIYTNCTKDKQNVIISTCVGHRRSKWPHRLCCGWISTFLHGGSCIFVAWQLSLSLSTVKLQSVCKFHLQRQYLFLKAAWCTAAQRSRAHLHQLDDPSLKVAVFSSFLAYLEVLFCF